MAAASTFQVTISAVDKATASIRKIKASIANVTKPATDLKASFSALSKEAGLDRVAKGIKSIGGAAQDAARHVASMVPAFAAIAGIGTVAGIAALATEFGKAGAEIGRTSGVIGVSASELQAFRGAAKLAGLSSEDMTGSLKTLGRTIEDATFGRNQDALVMMQKFGITLHKTKDGAVDATRALKEVANAIVAQKGNVQAQSLIAGTFGVESLLPLLQKGEKGIDEFVAKARAMGLVLSDKQLAKGEQFNANMLKLEASATKLKYAFGDAMAPAVERVINAVGRLVEKYGDVAATKIAEYVEKFATWLDHVDWEKTADSLGKFVDSIGGVKGIAIAIAAISFAGPIAGVLSLISNLTLLATVAAPAAIRALAGLGTAAAGASAGAAGAGAAGAAGAGAAGAAAGGGLLGTLGRFLVNPFTVGAFLGLRSGDLNSGEDEELARRRGSASGQASASDAVGFFQSKGWTKEQAAGIVANLRQESQMNPGAVGDNGKAYGVAQWHPDRQANFAKWAGKDIRKSSLDEQLAFVDHELRKGTEQSAGRALASAKTAQEAGNIVSRLYERPANSDTEAARRAQGAGSIVAANQPGATGDAGKVHVEIQLTGAPAGTKASVRSTGNASASVRIGNANVTGPSV
ncbi:phage tail tape measure protein [Cupriavidus sp. IDO]|uniref:phage tail tape measure protein n=1 Tax=Cupriavidus sp. IDO TaxID=1539142 RepID=UPI0005798CBA|nr:phage tail tape measure protein [Cupriavidus sp. IDO]KWR88765.1 hypothetical protein RM96_17780 [Cupriavidus sp. IDO]